MEPNNATTCKSIGSKILGDWRNWERSSFASFSQEFESPILHQIYPCVAQPGRALRLGRSGRMFESCHTDHIFPSRSAVDQRTVNPCVGGSIPPWGAKLEVWPSG